MSAFYDLASLVVVPSGYKSGKIYAQKPLTTDGQLSFTRSTGASRVASNGLIEKVRTNLLLQSNTFSTTWSASGGTVTSGQAGYDGTNNAWLFQNAVTTSPLLQSISLTSESRTFSVYAKKNANYGIRLYAFGSSNINAHFNLNTGTVITAVGDAKIEVVNSQWFRCSISGTQTITQASIYINNNTITQVLGSAIIQNAQLETGDIATDYIPTTTAAVSVGPVANVPRLDYLNSSCPRLILEGQRTNLALWSENFDNAGWGKFQSTIVANAATSPDGYANADKIVPTVVLDVHQVSQVPTLADNTSYAFSCFAKADGYNFLRLSPTTKAGATNSTFFNLSTGAIGAIGSGHTATIENYGNGWYRCAIVYNSGAGASSTTIRVAVSQSDNQTSFAGNGTSGILIYGAQHELGSYVSSYVNTLGAAVTRGADLAQKTSATALIGQTEGVLFVDFVMEAPEENRRFSLSDGTTSNRILIGQTTDGKILFYVSDSGASQVSFSTSTSYTKGTRLKIAFAYKENDFTGYINGGQILTDSSGTVPATFKFSFSDASDSSIFISSVNQALLFKTRLTNAQLAELTQL